MLPNFLGLGGNRSGSTWFAHNLMRHSDVFVPRKKELHFFDSEYDMGLDYYENQFLGWSGEKAIGEVTPAYFYSDNIARRVKEDLPGVKLFVSLRNPVDRAYSQYWRMVGMGSLDETITFEQAIETKETLLTNGQYSIHLSRYYRYFDPEDFCVLLFDNIKKEPQLVLGELFSFLGVDPDLDGDFTSQAVNASASLPNLGRSKSLWYLKRVINRLGVHSLRGTMERINRASLPPMKNETRLYLVDLFRDDILQTQDLIGKDLSQWLTLQKQNSSSRPG